MSSTDQTPPLPRGLILAASAWLVGSWALSVGTRSPLEPSSATYTPGVRLMLVCVTLGLMVAWPLMRLTRPPGVMPLRRTGLDLLVLAALLQVVVWPLRLVTPWSALRTAALDATIVGWAGLAGAAVAAAASSARAGPRCLAAAICVGMCLAGPAVAWTICGFGGEGDIGWLLCAGPVLEVLSLGGGGGGAPAPQEWRWVVLLALANAAAWTSLAVSAFLRGRCGSRAEPAAAA